MIVNQQAAALRTKLFELINEYKTLQLAVCSQPLEVFGGVDGSVEARSQIGAAAIDLTAVYESLGEIFTDAYAQQDMQRFAVTIVRD